VELLRSVFARGFDATSGDGLKLGLIGFVFGARGLKLGLIGFELGLFFSQIAVFGARSGEIGFVLHKKVFLCALVS